MIKETLESAMVCIRCDDPIEAIFPDTYQPYAGTMFHSLGHYGSTVFDPMDGSEISIILCDKCLVSAMRRSQVVLDSETSADILLESDEE